jgi:DNA-binding PadR family transcriptional regulator
MRTRRHPHDSGGERAFAHGRPDDLGPGWGRGPWGRRGGGRGRMRRGDIRTAVLAVLVDGPGHGYDIMSRLEEKSGGVWRPSAGSVYPTLQQLDDEGLVTATETDGKRVYTLTDEGRAEAERRVAEAGGEPWDRGGAHPGQLFRSIHGLNLAAKQVVIAGSAAELTASIAIVDRARQELYRLLADAPGDTGDAHDAPTH